MSPAARSECARGDVVLYFPRKAGKHLDCVCGLCQECRERRRGQLLAKCAEATDTQAVRDLTFMLAAANCAFCAGHGVVRARQGKHRVCACVFREVFRRCLGRYRFTVQNTAAGTCLSFSGERVSNGSVVFGQKQLEFCIDFELTAKQILTAAEWRLFQLHILGRLDWRRCALRLHMDKGTFFHHIYRIQNAVGLGLLINQVFPTRQYFDGRSAAWQTAGSGSTKFYA